MQAKIKIQAIHRLKRAAGQIRGLERMLREEKYCIDILHQALAIKKALSGFEDFILENHLKTHVVGQMKDGKVSKATREIMAVYKLSKQK